ncbi:hypothetical protein DSCOOX_24760 [Desulfosarcina ovata subsp. ovata]|uniref:Uncharacterized protein n=1 Tax=Desulfosarcina ovata subsp. ovata TaxID=2752305 RepID=A0A5K8A9X5_9BACT|nr:hypothetical protein DSCOOX_24760 [Desulfosarcina ovata subsp. ovata]
MVRPKVPVNGHKTIDSALSEAGFKTVFKSISNSSLIHYEGLIDGVDVEIEYNTPQKLDSCLRSENLISYKSIYE